MKIIKYIVLLLILIIAISLPLLLNKPQIQTNLSIFFSNTTNGQASIYFLDKPHFNFFPLGINLGRAKITLTNFPNKMFETNIENVNLGFYPLAFFLKKKDYSLEFENVNSICDITTLILMKKAGILNRNSSLNIVKNILLGKYSKSKIKNFKIKNSTINFTNAGINVLKLQLKNFELSDMSISKPFKIKFDLNLKASQELAQILKLSKLHIAFDGEITPNLSKKTYSLDIKSSLIAPYFYFGINSTLKIHGMIALTPKQLILQNISFISQNLSSININGYIAKEPPNINLTGTIKKFDLQKYAKTWGITFNQAYSNSFRSFFGNYSINAVNTDFSAKLNSYLDTTKINLEILGNGKETGQINVNVSNMTLNDYFSKKNDSYLKFSNATKITFPNIFTKNNWTSNDIFRLMRQFIFYINKSFKFTLNAKQLQINDLNIDKITLITFPENKESRGTLDIFENNKNNNFQLFGYMSYANDLSKATYTWYAKGKNIDLNLLFMNHSKYFNTSGNIGLIMTTTGDIVFNNNMVRGIKNLKDNYSLFFSQNQTDQKIKTDLNIFLKNTDINHFYILNNNFDSILKLQTLH